MCIILKHLYVKKSFRFQLHQNILKENETKDFRNKGGESMGFEMYETQDPDATHAPTLVHFTTPVCVTPKPPYLGQ